AGLAYGAADAGDGGDAGLVQFPGIEDGGYYVFSDFPTGPLPAGEDVPNITGARASFARFQSGLYREYSVPNGFAFAGVDAGDGNATFTIFVVGSGFFPRTLDGGAPNPLFKGIRIIPNAY